MPSLFQRNRVILPHLSFWCVFLSFNLYQISVFQLNRGGYDWGRMIASATSQLVFIMLIADLH
jgi:hypothetical protein